MNRRDFVRAMAAGATTAACSRAAPRRPGRAIGARAVAFDLFTIFDPRAIDAAVIAEVSDDGAELARLWKLRTFEYCWLRAAADRYVPFDRVLDDALTHSLAVRGRVLEPSARARLLSAWTELPAWSDAEESLVQLRQAGLVLAPLANFAPAMIEALLTRARLRAHFTHIISTDLARSYKPASRAYQLGVETFQQTAEAIVFAAFGGWDAVGATWFGYPTFWVNRLAATPEQLTVSPAGKGTTLRDLVAWTLARAG